MQKLKKLLSVFLSLAVITSVFVTNVFTASAISSEISPELITNGGFEKGNDSGFSFWGANYKEVSTEMAHSGSYSLKYLSTGNVYVRRAIDVEMNTDYAWSFWIIGTSGWNTHTFLADVYDSNEASALDIVISNPLDNHNDNNNGAPDGHWIKPTTKWRKYIIRFNSGNNSKIWLRLQKNNASTEGYLDDFSLTKLSDTMIQDASFEDGSAYSKGMYITTAISETEKYSGKSSLHIANYYNTNSGSKPYGVQNIVAVEKNTDYIWRFYIKGDKKSANESTVLTTENGVALSDGNWLGLVYVKSNILFSSFAEERTRIMSVTLSPQHGDSYKYENSVFKYKDDNWNYFEVTFNSADNTEVILELQPSGPKSFYTDDWSLRKAGTDMPSYYNEGAEYGTMENWVLSSDVDAEVSSDYAYTGKNSIHVTGEKTGNSVALRANAETNTDYIAVFRIKGDPASVTAKGATLARIKIKNSEKSDQSCKIVDISETRAGTLYQDNQWEVSMIENTVPNRWNTCAVKFNSGNFTSLLLTFETFKTNGFYIDDVKLVVYDANDTSFETGWNTFATNYYGYIAEPTLAKAHTGSGCMYFSYACEYGNATRTASKTYSVEKNTVYDFTVWLYDPGVIVSGKVHNNTSFLTVLDADGNEIALRSACAYGENDTMALNEVGTQASITGTYGSWNCYKISFDSGNNKTVKFAYNIPGNGNLYVHYKTYMDDLTLTYTGAVSGDELPSSDDLTVVKKQLLGTSQQTYSETASDVNGDGKFDIIDLVSLKKLLVEITAHYNDVEVTELLG